MNLDEELSQIERTLWTNDADVYGRTFLPDAVFIFPDVGRIDLGVALKALRGEKAAGHRWAEVDFQEIRVVTPAPEVALLSYVATARWNHKKDAEKALARRSTSNERRLARRVPSTNGCLKTAT